MKYLRQHLEPKKMKIEHKVCLKTKTIGDLSSSVLEQDHLDNNNVGHLDRARQDKVVHHKIEDHRQVIQITEGHHPVEWDEAVLPQAWEEVGQDLEDHQEWAEEVPQIR